MIKERHLNHWLGEIEYALNGLENETNKKGYAKCYGKMIHGDYLSFDYMREKEELIKRLIQCIRKDMVLDGVDQIA